MILSKDIPEITGFQLAYPMIYHGYSKKQNIIRTISGCWLTYPSEKYESQLG